MSFETWIIYVTTVLLLMSTPGPSHLLMLSNSMAHGFKPSLFTAAGDLTANMLQMLAAGLGLAALIIASEQALNVVKWAGVAYLAWLGIRMIIRAEHMANPKQAAIASHRALWLQGFLTSAANPKAVVFFTALFPQFIDPAKPFWLQFTTLSATYIVVDGAFLSAYGASSGWLASRLKTKGRVWLNRLSGSFVIVAAILLGLKTMRQVIR